MKTIDYGRTAFLDAEKRRRTRYTRSRKWKCACGRRLYNRYLPDRSTPDALCCLVCCKVVAQQLDIFRNEP